MVLGHCSSMLGPKEVMWPLLSENIRGGFHSIQLMTRLTSTSPPLLSEEVPAHVATSDLQNYRITVRVH